MIEAYHLPALADPPTETRRFGGEGEQVELRFARLTPALLARQTADLLDARDRLLARRPIADIVGAVDTVAERLLDRRDDLRRAAAATLPAITGSSPEMVDLVLDRMAADWRRPRLEALLASELGDAAVLDGFVDRSGGAAGRVMAVGPRLAAHYFSGNIPGVGVTSMIRTLLLRAATLGKTAAGEPVLAALFARGIAEADPDLGRCLAVAYWPGADRAMGEAALDPADAVIAYGGSEAVESVRSLAPAGARFVGYRHRLSFAVVAREALSSSAAGSLADAAALEVATFDQQGCVSPHLFYVEEGGEISPQAWARLLAGSLERLEPELPRGTIGAGESAAIRQTRAAAEFSGLGGSGVEMHGSAAGTVWTVIFDPDPAFEPSCLNRVARVKPITDISAVETPVSELRGLLQTVGVAGPPERIDPLARGLARLGVSRITPIGRMAWPPPTWHHDGRPALGDLVTWCDLE